MSRSRAVRRPDQPTASRAAPNRSTQDTKRIAGPALSDPVAAVPRRSLRNGLRCGAGALTALGLAIAATRGLHRRPDGAALVTPARQPVSSSGLSGKFTQASHPLDQHRVGNSLDDATRRQVQVSVRMMLDLYGDTPYFAREQSALPNRDTDPACAGIESKREAIFSLARWLKRGAPGADQRFDLGRELGIPFVLAQQNRIVSAVVSASPALRQSIEIVHDRGTAVRWGERDLSGSSWRYDLNEIHLYPGYSISAEMAIGDPMTLFGGALILVQALSHELQHAQSAFRLVEPTGFDSFGEFEHAFLDALAKEEATALLGELEVAQELFEATGVVLPLVNSDYRCGEAQAIFHASALSGSEKLDALKKYVIATHEAFGGDYKAQAAARWQQ